MIGKLRAALSSKPAMITISFGFTILAIWLVARDSDLHKVQDKLAAMPAWPFVIGFFGLVVGTFVRALRFHILMRATKSNFTASLEMILAGYFFTTVLPFRTGEIGRIGYFAKRANAPAATTTAGIVIERALDMLALALLGAIFFSGLVGEKIEGLAVPPWILGAVAGAGLLGALILGFWVRKRQSAKGNNSRFAKIYDDFLDGVRALGSVKDVAYAFFLSILLWLIVSFSIKIAYLSVDAVVPFADAVVVMLGTCLGVAIPAAPGFVGTYHYMFVAGAELVGIAKDISLPVAIVFHLVIQVPFLPIGGYLLFTRGRQFLKKSNTESDDSPA